MVRRALFVLLSLVIGLNVSSAHRLAISQQATGAVQLGSPQVGDGTQNAGDSQQPAGKDEPASKVAASEDFLPAYTKAWISIPDVDLLQQQFDKTQFGLLTKDESLKPFIDSLREQIKKWLNEKNVRLGIQIEDLQGVNSGEICLAGVLPHKEGDAPKQLGRGSHGLVLLVDVSNTEEKAQELLGKINQNMAKRGAVRGKMDDIHGVKITKWNIEAKPNRLRKTHSTYHAIAGGWLLASDNENIFREIVRRLVNMERVERAETLALHQAFVSVMQRTDLPDAEPHVRWFIDPFGYVQLAQAISDADQEFRQRHNDYAEVLQNEGFDAIKGLGGKVSFMAGEHQLLHRSFVYAPRNGLQDENQKRVFGLFDFRNKYDTSFDPDAWVPHDVSAYFKATWDMSKALNNVGHVFNAFIGEEDSFQNMLNGWKTDMQVDLPKLVAMFDNQITVISAAVKPITERSERVVIGMKIKSGPDDVFKNVKRLLGVGNVNMIKIAGHDVIEVDTTVEENSPEFNDPIYDDPIFGGEDSDSEAEDDEVEVVVEEFHLFEKRYFVVSGGYLLIANDSDYLKKVLTEKQGERLEAAEDYVRIKQAIGKLTDSSKVSFRQFGRIDKALHTNYEMIRQGKMGASQTVLARLLNQILITENAVEQQRSQKMDGSKLPEDYETKIAPYLGPSGWVMESVEDGWIYTGCMLKKKDVTEMVRRIDDQSRR